MLNYDVSFRDIKCCLRATFSPPTPISNTAVLTSSASASAVTPSSPIVFPKTRLKSTQDESNAENKLLTGQINIRQRCIAFERVGQRFDTAVANSVACNNKRILSQGATSQTS